MDDRGDRDFLNARGHALHDPQNARGRGCRLSYGHGDEYGCDYVRDCGHDDEHVHEFVRLYGDGDEYDHVHVDEHEYGYVHDFLP